MEYDIIVVGAGLGGLTAASRLAILGYKVAVFEQHYRAGGYASSFYKDGYEFDISLHAIPGLLDGGNLHRMLQCCQVAERIEALKYNTAYSIRINGEEIVIPNDIIHYKEMLLSRFPKEEHGIKQLFQDLGYFEEGFQRHMLGEKRQSVKWHKDSLLFLRWSKMTCYDVVKSYVKDEGFIRIFTAFWPNFGLPPKKLSALTFFITWVSYHYHGKYYIDGGAMQLTEAFLSVMQEHGVSIFYDANVVKILDQGKKASGIQLESGEIHTADWIICNANPQVSLSLIRKDMISKRIARKITRSNIGCSLSQLYLGLDCSAYELGILQEEIFVCCGKNHEEDYQMAVKNNYMNAGYLLTNYSRKDTSEGNERRGILTMTYINKYSCWNECEEEYRQQKEQVMEQMIERLITDYPMVKGHIVVKELATPKTMERYTNNRFGAVYGYRQDVKHSGKRRLQRNIGIPGFSYVGAWVSPGGGYEGTITGAIMEAQKIHHRLKKIYSISK